MEDRLNDAQKSILSLLAVPELCGSVSLSEFWRVEFKHLITTSVVISLLQDLEKRGLISRCVATLEPGEVEADPSWELTGLGKHAVALNRQYSRQEIKEVS